VNLEGGERDGRACSSRTRNSQGPDGNLTGSARYNVHSRPYGGPAFAAFASARGGLESESEFREIESCGGCVV